MIDKTKNESEKNTGAKGEDIIAGRNAVNEALRSGRIIDSLYVARGQKTGSLTALIAKAKQKDITIKEADVKKLDFMCGNANHQHLRSSPKSHCPAIYTCRRLRQRHTGSIP